MNKLGIWAIAIAGAFVIGVLSANPVVEAAQSGWQAANTELKQDIESLFEDVDDLGDDITAESIEREAGDAAVLLEARNDITIHELDSSAHHDIPESQVYEVSGVSVIPAGSTIGSFVELRCLNGDMFLKNVEPRLFISLDPSLDTTNLSVGTTAVNVVLENKEGVQDFNKRIIGFDTRARQFGATQSFEIPTTIIGLCLDTTP